MKAAAVLVILLRFLVTVFGANLGYELVEHRLEDLQVKLFDFATKNDNQINRLLERMIKLESLVATVVQNQRSLDSQTKANKNPVVTEHSRILRPNQVIPSCKLARASGTFKLQFLNIQVYCEMSSYDGGWLVVQQRVDLKLDFHRNWTEYRNGFGVVGQNEEFWLGLEAIHQITNDGQYELVIEFKSDDLNINGKQRNGYARYSQFHVADESDKYRLTVGGYSGALWNFFSSFNNVKFTTYDSDNDNVIGGNCANYNGGGWWYNKCGWIGINARGYSTFSRMMIRQK